MRLWEPTLRVRIWLHVAVLPDTRYTSNLLSVSCFLGQFLFASERNVELVCRNLILAIVQKWKARIRFVLGDTTLVFDEKRLTSWARERAVMLSTSFYKLSGKKKLSYFEWESLWYNSGISRILGILIEISCLFSTHCLIFWLHTGAQEKGPKKNKKCIEQCFKIQKERCSPLVMTLHYPCRGAGFNPWSGN